jgi:CBS domain-containing protein
VPRSTAAENAADLADFCGAPIESQLSGRVERLTRRNSISISTVVEPTGMRGAGVSPVEGGDPMTVQTILANKGNNVLSIEPTASLEAAVAMLAKHRVGALVVLGPDRRVIGILSERDVVRALAERGAVVLAEPLAQVMTRKVVTCSQSDTVGALMERMTTGKFRHLPVIEQDQLVGIVSIGDVVKLRVHEMEQESAALRDYIQTA